MDPLSATGLTVNLVQIISAVTKTIQYLNAIKSAPKDRARLAQEAASLLCLVTSLQYKLEATDSKTPWSVGIRSLGGLGGPLEQYKVALEELVNKLEQGTGIARRFIWTLDRTDIERSLEMIERLKSHIGLALQEDTL